MLHPPFCRRQLTRFVASIYIYIHHLPYSAHPFIHWTLLYSVRQPGSQASRQAGRAASLQREQGQRIIIRHSVSGGGRVESWMVVAFETGACGV